MKEDNNAYDRLTESSDRMVKSWQAYYINYFVDDTKKVKPQQPYYRQAEQHGKYRTSSNNTRG